MLRLTLTLLIISGTALAEIPVDGYCHNPAYQSDPFQAFGNLVVFGHRAEKQGLDIPPSWRRPDGFFKATWRGETSCTGVGPVAIEISIDLRAQGSYSNHPHILIFDADGEPLLDRWIWPEYRCNYFEYDMERAMRAYDGPIDLGKLQVSVLDLATVLNIQLKGCRRLPAYRQPRLAGD